MKNPVLLVIFLLFLVPAATFPQHSFTWDAANLTMELPFNTDTIETENGDKSLLFILDDLELEFLTVPKDSVNKYYSDPWPQLIEEIVNEFDIIPLSEPALFPFTPEGLWITCLDTTIFTDSLVIGALSHPSADIVVLAVIDCYGFPLSVAINIMRSLRLEQPATREEED